MTINNPAYQKSFEALQSCSGNERVKGGSSKDSMRRARAFGEGGVAGTKRDLV